MSLLHWTIQTKRLDLKYTWAISRNATNFKVNAFVSVSDGQYSGSGEAAPNIRYGESPEQFESCFNQLDLQAGSLNALVTKLAEQKVPNALRFAIESAYVHFVCAKQGVSVGQYLGVKQLGAQHTSYTIPIMPLGDLASYFQRYQPQRFKYVKIKVNAENLIDFIKEVRKCCPNPLMIDANEAYTNPDQFLFDLERSAERNIVFVEQPFPASQLDEAVYLKPICPFPVFADESITDQVDFAQLEKGFHGVNVKLMKAGGYLNAIHLLREARSHGLHTMIGCMVETGLGIASGLHLASLSDYLDLDSFLILQHDPFPFVKETEGKLDFTNFGL